MPALAELRFLAGRPGGRRALHRAAEGNHGGAAARGGSHAARHRDHRPGNYLYAEFRSKLLGYVDDVEFFHDGAVIQVRSASRLGRRDFGVNRKRVEDLRALITQRP